MVQYLLGLASGIVAASIGAYVTVWLEGRKEARKDQSVLQAFKEELISNIEMISANSIELESEIEITDNDQHLLTGLTPYYFPTWDLLKTRIPKKLSGEDVLRKLGLLMHFALLINNEIESRENFKINGAALTGFADTLKKRDQLLLMRNEKLLVSIMDLREDLDMKIDFKSKSKSLSEAAKRVQPTP